MTIRREFLPEEAMNALHKICALTGNYFVSYEDYGRVQLVFMPDVRSRLQERAQLENESFVIETGEVLPGPYRTWR